VRGGKLSIALPDKKRDFDCVHPWRSKGPFVRSAESTFDLTFRRVGNAIQLSRFAIEWVQVGKRIHHLIDSPAAAREDVGTIFGWNEAE
jgi:hypothetical protein